MTTKQNDGFTAWWAKNDVQLTPSRVLGDNLYESDVSHLAYMAYVSGEIAAINATMATLKDALKWATADQSKVKTEEENK